MPRRRTGADKPDCRWYEIQDLDGTRLHMPPHLNARLQAATTAKQVEQIIREEEYVLAFMCPQLQRAGVGETPYLWCDQAAELMHDVLWCKHIPHETIVGWCDEGSSHAWVRAEGVDLDPTDQGCLGPCSIIGKY